MIEWLFFLSNTYENMKINVSPLSESTFPPLHGSGYLYETTWNNASRNGLRITSLQSPLLLAHGGSWRKLEKWVPLATRPGTGLSRRLSASVKQPRNMPKRFAVWADSDCFAARHSACRLQKAHVWGEGADTSVLPTPGCASHFWAVISFHFQ